MLLNRRQLLEQTLLASVGLGLRAVACGLPPAVLLHPHRALAEGSPLARAMASGRRPQYLVLNTWSQADPINCNVPGSYTDAKMVHPTQASMAATNVTLGGKVYKAAAPWATLGARLQQTCFFHHATFTSNHPDSAKVQRLNDAVTDNESLVSAVSTVLAPTLGTIQMAPVAIGREPVVYRGRTQPNLTPTGIKTILAGSGLTAAFSTKAIIARRDADVDKLNAISKEAGNTIHADFLDRYALSQQQARQASENAASSLEKLNAVGNDGQAAQLVAALTLVKMKLAPAAVITMNFGGDNHADVGLVGEAIAHVAALADLNASYFANVAATEDVTFASFNVFGRDNGYLLANGAFKGRDHNSKHSVMVLNGPNVASGVVGGMVVGPMNAAASQYGPVATAIDSGTGASVSQGDVAASDTLLSAGATLAAALGVDDTSIAAQIPGGKVVAAALV